MLKLIFNLKHALIIVEKIIAAGSLLLLLALTLFQIIARNFFDTGFSELEIISRHLILFIAFMGAALVSESNNHIKIDILSAFLSTKQKEQTVRPLLVLSAVVCGLFAWYSGQFWLDEWRYASANDKLGAYLALILPTGFIILSLHLLLLTATGFEHEETPKPK